MLQSVQVFLLVICSLSKIAAEQSFSANVHENRTRYPRATATAPTIEVLVVADESMVKFHGNASVRRYVLTIMAKVSLENVDVLETQFRYLLFEAFFDSAIIV